MALKLRNMQQLVPNGTQRNLTNRAQSDHRWDQETDAGKVVDKPSSVPIANVNGNFSATQLSIVHALLSN